MTIERTRELLQDEIKDMSDEQVKDLIARYSQLADVVIDLMKRETHNSTVTRRRMHE